MYMDATLLVTAVKFGREQYCNSDTVTVWPIVDSR